MSSKNTILENIKRNIQTRYNMPSITLNAITYADKLSQFKEISKVVGGNVIELDNGADINSVIRECYPDAKTIVSNMEEITIKTTNVDTIEDPHLLNGTDLGVIQGEFGVAENGCIWVPQNVRQKALYFIAEYLVIILDRKNIVNNMHEAYDAIDFHGQPFGIFISGPSKTADIEQALVIGAHGAKGVTILLR